LFSVIKSSTILPFSAIQPCYWWHHKITIQTKMTTDSKILFSEQMRWNRTTVKSATRWFQSSLEPNLCSEEEEMNVSDHRTVQARWVAIIPWWAQPAVWTASPSGSWRDAPGLCIEHYTVLPPGWNPLRSVGSPNYNITSVS
jgi:hypothetical protein